MINYQSFLEKLSNANGIAGREQEIISMLAEIVRPWTDELHITSLGSLIAIKKGSGPHHPRLMISTHIDEIGFVVSALEEGSFARIEPRGGIDLKVLPGQMLQILSKDGPIPAVVCTIPPHLLLPEERNKVSGYEQLFLDTGLEEDEFKRRVQIGQPVLFEASFLSLKDKRYSGKALDNRASAVVSIALLESLQYLRHSWDICCVFSTQEEVGCKGAKTAAYELHPSCAIAMDVTYGDQSGMKETDTFALGNALPLGVGPNFSKKFLQLIQQAGREEQISTVPEPMSLPMGTDASTIQTSLEGIPTALISLPLRYMHSPVETVDEKDLVNAVRLLRSVIRLLDTDHKEGFKCI